MKKLSIFFAVLLALGCSDGEPSVRPSSEEARRVEVEFSMEAVETDSALEPMTRATAYKTWIANGIRMLILKKVGTRWIVDASPIVVYDPEKSWFNELQIAELPPFSFSFELRPGYYRIVAVINAHMTRWNNELVPGKVVADEADASLPTPSLVTYMISTHWMNDGLRQLNREIFVAVSEFDVPKTGDLHSTGRPAVKLHAERRVGKFRLLLKKNTTPNYPFFDNTAHKFTALFTATEKPFPQGIDALGEMYYGSPETHEMEWCFTTISTFHPSGADSYQISQTNSTVYSPFMFVGPDDGEIPFKISNIYISGAVGGYSYKTDQVFTRNLACNRTCGIVFRTSDDPKWDPLIHIVESQNSAGEPENAAVLFDSFFEWNAASN